MLAAEDLQCWGVRRGIVGDNTDKAAKPDTETWRTIFSGDMQNDQNSIIGKCNINIHKLKRLKIMFLQRGN